MGLLPTGINYEMLHASPGTLLNWSVLDAKLPFVAPLSLNLLPFCSLVFCFSLNLLPLCFLVFCLSLSQPASSLLSFCASLNLLPLCSIVFCLSLSTCFLPVLLFSASLSLSTCFVSLLSFSSSLFSRFLPLSSLVFSLSLHLLIVTWLPLFLFVFQKFLSFLFLPSFSDQGICWKVKAILPAFDGLTANRDQLPRSMLLSSPCKLLNWSALSAKLLMLPFSQPVSSCLFTLFSGVIYRFFHVHLSTWSKSPAFSLFQNCFKEVICWNVKNNLTACYVFSTNWDRLARCSTVHLMHYSTGPLRLRSFWCYPSLNLFLLASDVFCLSSTTISSSVCHPISIRLF